MKRFPVFPCHESCLCKRSPECSRNISWPIKHISLTYYLFYFIFINEKKAECILKPYHLMTLMMWGQYSDTLFQKYSCKGYRTLHFYTITPVNTDTSGKQAGRLILVENEAFDWFKKKHTQVQVINRMNGILLWMGCERSKKQTPAR